MNSRKRATKPAAILPAAKDLGKPANPSEPTSEADWLAEREEARQFKMAQVGATLAVLAPHTTLTIDSLALQIHDAMSANGFWHGEAGVFGVKAALIHSEVSELLEANRNQIKSDDKIPDFTGEEAEAADIIIRLLDMAGAYNWRLGEAITAKMQYNLTRPFKHGKSY